jgi:DNA modification methylase
VLADVERVLGGQLADMCFTDSPYNVDYANSPKDKLRGKHRPILNDNLGSGFEAFLYDSCINVLSVTKGAVYWCMSSSELHTLQRAFAAAGGHWSTFIVWAKHTLHARPRRLSTPIRADPVRLEGGQRSLLVRCPGPGRRVVLR